MNLLPIALDGISVLVACIGVVIIFEALIRAMTRDPSEGIGGALVQTIFGAGISLFGWYGIPYVFKDVPGVSPESDAPTTETPPTTAPEPTPTPEVTPTPEPAPEPPIDFSNVPWGMLGIIALVLIGIVVLFFVIDAIRTERDNRYWWQQNVLAIRHGSGDQLRSIMAEFTEATSDPLNTLKYPLYRTTAHPVHQNYINAMMAAYNEQHALDNAIAEHFDRKPGRIDAERFQDAVGEATERWVTLKYQAKKIGSPLLSIDVQERANKLLAVALDEHNHATERDLAMSKLVTLLEDARETLTSTPHRSLMDKILRNNTDADTGADIDDSVMFINAMLDAITDAQRNNNVLRAPDALLQLAAATDEETRQNLDMPAIQQ